MNAFHRLFAPEPPSPLVRRRRSRRALPPIRRAGKPTAHRVRLRGRKAEPRERAGWRRVLPDVLLASLLFALSLTQNMAAVDETFFHPDESRWLNRAYYARDIADPFGPTWQEYVTTIGQPPLGSYLMGIGLALQGRPLDATGSWDFAYGADWNAQAGAMPSAEDLTAGRRINAVVGALVVAAVYWAGRLLTNRVGGVIGALFLALHPLHITLSSQALSDEIFVLTLALAFAAAWHLARRPTWARAILLGVLLGLGGAAKLTPLLLSLPLAAFGVLRLVTDRDRPARDDALKLLVQPAIAFATFVVVYPYLWPAPIRRTWRLFAFRAEEMRGQAAAWPDLEVTSPLDALARFGQRLTYVDATTKRLLQPIVDALGIDRTISGVDLIPAIAGIILLVWWVVRRGLWTPTALMALLMGAEAGAIVVGMGTDFYRYHLPIVVILTICIAASTGALWSWFASRTRLASHPAPARQHIAGGTVAVPSRERPIRVLPQGTTFTAPQQDAQR